MPWRLPLLSDPAFDNHDCDHDDGGDDNNKTFVHESFQSLATFLAYLAVSGTEFRCIKHQTLLAVCAQLELGTSVTSRDK